MVNAFYRFLSTEIKISLEYRSSIISGLLMQIFWGWLGIAIFSRFLEESSCCNNEISKICSYIWMMQAFLGFTALWIRDDNILKLIKTGDIAYEFIRPLHLFTNWFFKIFCKRMAMVIISGIPIILYSLFFVPKIYSLCFPISLWLFCISIIVAFFVSALLTTFINVVSAISSSSDGIIYINSIFGSLFIGSMVPIPLLPAWFQKIVFLLPYSAIADIPFRIYTGYIESSDAYKYIFIQLAWVLVFLFINAFLFHLLKSRLVVSGG